MTGTRTHVADTRIEGSPRMLAGLVDQLALLVGVIVAACERARVGQRVERDLVGVGVGCSDVALV